MVRRISIFAVILLSLIATSLFMGYMILGVIPNSHFEPIKGNYQRV